MENNNAEQQVQDTLNALGDGSEWQFSALVAELPYEPAKVLLALLGQAKAGTVKLATDGDRLYARRVSALCGLALTVFSIWGGGSAIGQTCRNPGMVRPDLPRCTLTSLPEAGQGEDPDMAGREGIPPNSLGSGSR